METQQGGGARRAWAAFNIVQRKGSEKAYWNRIGSAFRNHDGSFNVYLDSFPVGGKLQLREDDREGREGREAKRGQLAEATEEV